MTSQDLRQTERNTIGRAAHRGSYDRNTAKAILDEGLLCHLGLTTDRGPVVIPTTYARDGDTVIIHGSPAATWLRTTGKGADVCLTVTLLDGLVLARSAFHHSMNYRSVVVFGVATVVDDLDEKRAAMDLLTDHVVPGRMAEVRPTTDDELRKTLVLTLPLVEASVKVRTGGPIDDDEDYALDEVWAGVVPLHIEAGRPIDDDLLRFDLAAPASARTYRRP